MGSWDAILEQSQKFQQLHHRNRDWLLRQLQSGATTTQMAQECGASAETIRYWLNQLLPNWRYMRFDKFR